MTNLMETLLPLLLIVKTRTTMMEGDDYDDDELDGDFASTVADCEDEDDDDGGSSDGDVDAWVGGKGDKGGDGGGKMIDYAEDAVMMQMEDDEIEAEAADEQEDSSGPSDSDDSEVEYEERMATERYDEKALQ